MGLLSRFTKKNDANDSRDSGEYRSRAQEDSLSATRGTERRASSARSKARTDDPLLPEKKRARRRLIGAVALALAAVIGLPMILDSDPRSLPDDIQVRIPSKDKAPELANASVAEPVAPRKATEVADDAQEEIIEPESPVPDKKTSPAPVAQLKDSKPVAAAATVAAVTAATVVAVKSEQKNQAKPENKSAKNDSKTDAKADTREARNDAPKADTKQVAAAKNKTPEKDTQPEHKTEAVAKQDKQENKPAKTADEGDGARAMAILEGKSPAKTAAKSERIVLQVAALASQEKVDELQAKLKAAGIHSYTQKVATSSGDKIRIRVGPYDNKDEADKARARLAKLGLNGSPVSN